MVHRHAHNIVGGVLGVLLLMGLAFVVFQGCAGRNPVGQATEGISEGDDCSQEQAALETEQANQERLAQEARERRSQNCNPLNSDSVAYNDCLEGVELDYKVEMSRIKREYATESSNLRCSQERDADDSAIENPTLETTEDCGDGGNINRRHSDGGLQQSGCASIDCEAAKIHCDETLQPALKKINAEHEKEKGYCRTNYLNKPNDPTAEESYSDCIILTEKSLEQAVAAAGAEVVKCLQQYDVQCDF